MSDDDQVNTLSLESGSTPIVGRARGDGNFGGNQPRAGTNSAGKDRAGSQAAAAAHAAAAAASALAAAATAQGPGDPTQEPSAAAGSTAPAEASSGSQPSADSTQQAPTASQAAQTLPGAKPAAQRAAAAKGAGQQTPRRTTTQAAAAAAGPAIPARPSTVQRAVDGRGTASRQTAGGQTRSAQTPTRTLPAQVDDFSGDEVSDWVRPPEQLLSRARRAASVGPGAEAREPRWSRSPPLDVGRAAVGNRLGRAGPATVPTPSPRVQHTPAAGPAGRGRTAQPAPRPAVGRARPIPARTAADPVAPPDPEADEIGADDFEDIFADADLEEPAPRYQAPANPARRLTREQILALGAAGGVAALALRASRGLRSLAVDISRIKAVPEQSITALFGTSRAILLRLSADVSDEGLKSYKARRAALDICAKSGTAVPDDVSRELVFYHFQQDHAAILRAAPLNAVLVEPWMHGFARWAVRDRGDETQSPEFTYMTQRASEVLEELDALDRALSAESGGHLRAGTRTGATDLIMRFSTFRTEHVRKLVKHGLQQPALADLHDDFSAILAAYEQLHAAAPRYLEGLKRQADNEGTAYSKDPQQQEAYIGRVLGGIFRAFIRGLLGNQLKPPDGTRAKTGHPAATPNPTASPPSLAATFNFSPQSTMSTPAPGYTAGFQAAHGGFATVQQHPADQYPSSGPYSLDSQARQIACGSRQVGPYIGPNPGPANDGLGLSPELVRLLYAHQVLAGHRAPGALVSIPPDNLPPLAPLDVVHAARHGFGAVPAPGMGTFFALPAPPPYSTNTPTPTPPYVTGGTRSRPKTLQETNPTLSDELYIPYSYGMLGSFSPYRNMRRPESCYECGMRDAHYGNECAQRFVRVRGEAPPGWRRNGRTAEKDPAQWNGADLTDDARAAYRTFLAAVPVVQHRNFPITVDEIAGSAPPLARKGLGGTRP